MDLAALLRKLNMNKEASEAENLAKSLGDVVQASRLMMMAAMGNPYLAAILGATMGIELVISAVKGRQPAVTTTIQFDVGEAANPNGRESTG
jgi:hypothetical protein